MEKATREDVALIRFGLDAGDHVRSSVPTHRSEKVARPTLIHRKMAQLTKVGGQAGSSRSIYR